MFSELLYLRFNHVLEQRAAYLIEHIESHHVPGRRLCCVNRSDNLHEMYFAVNQVEQIYLRPWASQHMYHLKAMKL